MWTASAQSASRIGHFEMPERWNEDAEAWELPSQGVGIGIGLVGEAPGERDGTVEDKG
jgi:hypothetical protein